MISTLKLQEIIQLGIEKGLNKETALTKKEGYAYNFIVSKILQYKSLSISVNINEFTQDENDTTRYRNILQKLIIKGYILIENQGDNNPIKKIKLNLKLEENTQAPKQEELNPIEEIPLIKTEEIQPVEANINSSDIIIPPEVKEAIEKTTRYARINGVNFKDKQCLFVDVIIRSMNEHKKFIGEVKMLQEIKINLEGKEEINAFDITPVDDFYIKKEITPNPATRKTVESKFELALKKTYRDYKKHDTGPFTLTEGEWTKYNKFAIEYTNANNGFDNLILKQGGYWLITPHQWKQNQLHKYETPKLINLIWEIQKWIQTKGEEGISISTKFSALLKTFADKNKNTTTKQTGSETDGTLIAKNNPFTLCICCNRDNTSHPKTDTSPPDFCDMCVDLYRENNIAFSKKTSNTKGGIRKWNSVLMEMLEKNETSLASIRKTINSA